MATVEAVDETECFSLYPEPVEEGKAEPCHQAVVDASIRPELPVCTSEVISDSVLEAPVLVLEQSPAPQVLVDLEGVDGDALSLDTPCLSPPIEQPPDTLVLVLLGRVGAGKSSTGNTLLGSDVNADAKFVAKRAASAVTKACSAVEVRLPVDLVKELNTDYKRVLVIDTPGLGDSSASDIETMNEIKKGVSDLIPGSSRVCLLLIFSLASRVGEDELNTVTGLRDNVFGHCMFGCSLVVWTHHDLLERDDELQQYLQDIDPRLRDMLDGASGGSVSISNKQIVGGQRAQLHNILSKAIASSAEKCPFTRPGCEVGAKRLAGRKSARRQRQLEAGVLKQRVGTYDPDAKCGIM